MKAILVIDNMPQNCLDCPCSFAFGSPPHNICEAMNDMSLTKENMNNTKPVWCPLKTMPQKVEIDKEVHLNYRAMNKGYQCGWNDCLDEILGDTE